MTLIGKDKLDKFAEDHNDVRSQLQSWVQEVKEVVWNTPNDIKKRYSSADFVKNNCVIINMKGNKYRLLIKVNYKLKIVAVKDIATHSEYDKWKLN